MAAGRSDRSYAFLALTIVLAAALRCWHLDWKLYGFDENVTSVRASGHTLADLHAFVHDGRRHALSDLSRFSGFDPATSVADVVRSLAREDPQHAPPYFLLERGVAAALGTAIWARRLAPVVFGIALVPAIFWLGVELFEDRRAAALAAVLVAVSPFHVAYAQQAREYSLWALLACVASATLLHALRARSAWQWVGYAALVAAGLWTFPLFALVVVAHALFVSVDRGETRSARTGFWLAAAAGTAAFLPWTAVMIAGAQTALRDTTWLAQPMSLTWFVAKWVFNAGATFFDLEYLGLRWLPVALAALAVAACAAVRFVRRAPRRAVLFVALFGAVDLAALLVPDALFHSTRSTAARYATPLWLALELATAYGLAASPNAGGVRGAARRTGAAFLIAAGFLSCSVSAFARSWWLADADAPMPAIAQRLATLPAPTIVAVGDDTYLLELATVLPDGPAYVLRDRLGSGTAAPTGHPYAIARPDVVGAFAEPASLRAVPLPPVFPRRDAPLQRLRDAAASERGTSTARSTVTLWDASHATAPAAARDQTPGSR